MSTYYTVPADRIAALRQIADQLKNTQELQALCMLYGLRSMQEADEDMLKSGDIGPEHLMGKNDCDVRAAEFLEDTLCSAEFLQVVGSNDMGDYSLKAVPVVTIVKSI